MREIPITKENKDSRFTQREDYVPPKTEKVFEENFQVPRLTGVAIIKVEILKETSRTTSPSFLPQTFNFFASYSIAISILEIPIAETKEEEPSENFLNHVFRTFAETIRDIRLN